MNAIKILRRNVSLLVLTALFLVRAIAVAQTDSQGNDFANADGQQKIVVDVWAADANGAPGPPLSRSFAVAGLSAMTGLREWQGQLAHTIRNGYPLDEHGIELYSERAADRLTLAALAASTDADRSALSELTNQYENLVRWSEEMVDANRNLEMAQFYMSHTALENNSLFQKTVECANFLAPMLASGHLSEGDSCR